MAATKEKFKVEHGVFDNFTIQTLKKLSADGHFDGLKSPISIGKESNVFAAETKDNTYIIVKIYRLENADFNRMYDYIKFDPRFSGLLKQRRKVIFAWCQREYRNLLLAREAGVSCPTPLAFRNNVLLEEFIGNSSPAPRLVNSPPKSPEKLFNQLMKNIKLLYTQHMTHGDLSAFNVLNHNETPVLIDFSQATTSENSSFDILFERDITTVCNYFTRLGLNPMPSQIIKTITGAS